MANKFIKCSRSNRGISQVNSGQKPPFQFIHHDMAAQYREEERKLVKSLKEKLLAVPMKGRARGMQIFI